MPAPSLTYLYDVPQLKYKNSELVLQHLNTHTDLIVVRTRQYECITLRWGRREWTFMSLITIRKVVCLVCNSVESIESTYLFTKYILIADTN